MTSAAAAGPWRIPDATPPAEREAMLDRLADAGAREPAVLAIAARCAATCGALARLARRDGACDLDAAACALAAAQAFPYVPDPPGEWFQSVRYTLAHGGDCEDLATLVVALARALGLPARVVWMEEDARLPLNHVSAQICARGVWLWAEATVPGARLGEEPHAAVARTGRAVAGLSAA